MPKQPFTLAQLAPASRPRAKIDRPSVIVVSHERSGTHFLMNTLGRSFGYDAGLFVNFDYTPVNINYFHPQGVLKALRSVPLGHLVKAHHAVEFFDGILDELLQSAVILYIHRDPVDVMISTWRYVHGWDWREGPAVIDPGAFARAEPEGHMLRYQMRQKRSMLVRWADHVDGWLDAAGNRERLHVVAYERLRDRYAETVEGLSPLLGAIGGPLNPPDKMTNVVRNTPKVALPKPNVAELREVALAEVGKTMRRLGYT